MGKMLRLLLLGALIVALMATFIYADETASATKRVAVIVQPNIGIGAGDPQPATIQTGKFRINIPFKIDANTQYIKLYIIATHLYKADDPTNSEVPPILVYTNEKCVVKPLNGNESGGAGDNKLEWDGAGAIGAYEGVKTVTGVFESSQAGRFSMPVDVVVTWNQDDHEKPVGEYSGFVKMLAAVMM